MNRISYLLLALALLQGSIVASLYWTEHSSGQATGAGTLADAGPYLVDELRFADSPDSEVKLRKQGDRWLLPQLGDLPADAEKIGLVLQELRKKDPGWVVAQTRAARQRFQVADYHFRRKITLLAQGQEISTVYLGTSPGFRKVHARNDKQNEIYSVGLNLFDIPVQRDGWLDRSLLQVRAPLRIIADGYSLNRDSGRWQLGSGASPDERELQALLSALRGLQVEGVAPAEIREEVEAQEAELILQVEGLGGSTTFSLYQRGEEHLISSSEFPYLFRLSKYSFEQLTGIDAFLLSGAQ